MFGLQRLIVLASVHLDDEQPIDADEVEVVAAERPLAPEVVAERVQALQTRPKSDFGLGHVVAKAASPGGGRCDQS